MNLLLDSLPETVLVDGKEYFIDTDFRTFIIFEKIVNGDDAPKKKVSQVIELFFTDKVPENTGAAIDAVLDIYKCGQEAKQKPVKRNGNVELKSPDIFDYEYDAPYIFGAFFAQYGIDLNDIEYMHWWKFQALFKSLESHNKIVEIMGYRACDISHIENSKERERIARLKALYALPQNLTREDKIAIAGAAFRGAF
ncbi:MAG: bacteriophage Gp15 family protein [Clostridia bacterium]|nr:bacteriophage Gp15 family protein [Clostridia bacterium]